MKIDEIEKAHWTNTEAQKAVIILVQDFLNAAPPGTKYSTSAIVRAIGGKDIKAVASHLTNARNNGLLDGYFSRDEKLKTFGQARVVWEADVE